MSTEIQWTDEGRRPQRVAERSESASVNLALMVRDPVPLAEPVPAKGALGWWTPTDEVIARLREASHA